MDEITADVAAPEQEITAVPESVETEPNTQETVEETPKTFTQEELDAAIGKRLAKERRKWERDLVSAQQQPVMPQQIPQGTLNAEQFETYEQYAEALAVQKAAELVAQRDMHLQRQALDNTYAEREEAALDKYDDFREVAYNPQLRITPEMADVIKASEVGPDLAYWLGTNPKEAERIARLSPLNQARELGKIEVKIGSEPPVKKASSAPAPIKPVTARGTTASVYDTTDPRSVSSMSTSEWIEAERARQIRKQEAQRR